MLIILPAVSMAALLLLALGVKGQKYLRLRDFLLSNTVRKRFWLAVWSIKSKTEKYTCGSGIWKAFELSFLLAVFYTLAALPLGWLNFGPSDIAGKSLFEADPSLFEYMYLTLISRDSRVALYLAAIVAILGPLLLLSHFGVRLFEALHKRMFLLFTIAAFVLTLAVYFGAVTIGYFFLLGAIPFLEVLLGIWPYFVVILTGIFTAAGFRAGGGTKFGDQFASLFSRLSGMFNAVIGADFVGYAFALLGVSFLFDLGVSENSTAFTLLLLLPAINAAGDTASLVTGSVMLKRLLPARDDQPKLVSLFTHAVTDIALAALLLGAIVAMLAAGAEGFNRVQGETVIPWRDFAQAAIDHPCKQGLAVTIMIFTTVLWTAAHLGLLTCALIVDATVWPIHALRRWNRLEDQDPGYMRRVLTLMVCGLFLTLVMAAVVLAFKLAAAAVCMFAPWGAQTLMRIAEFSAGLIGSAPPV